MNRPLRIAILAPISARVPPRYDGPGEQVAASLAEALVDRGHEVALFATEDSLTNATLKAVCPSPQGIEASMERDAWNALHVGQCLEQANSFDIIHNHCGFLPLAFSRFVRTPIVTTIYGMTPGMLPFYERFHRRMPLVAVSDGDRAPTLEYAATIHHGITMRAYDFHQLSEGYLLFFGLITPDSGVLEAIELARSVRRRLVIAGNVADQPFFERQVQPQLSDLIDFIGPIGPEHRGEVLGGAAVLLQLGTAAQALSILTIEAMASGTPVLALPIGGNPEIIRSGENGFLVNSPDQAVELLSQSLQVDRAGVRASVEKRFDTARMVDEYVDVYRRFAPGAQTPAASGRNGAKRVIVRNPATPSRVRQK
jgi:glycosyltransferase involved in cell wall biosynthesis